jgi:hypothetical protein
VSNIDADRAKAQARADEMMKPYLDQINSTPELLSLLYDIDMLPEQTTSIIGATRLAAFCEVWKRMEYWKSLVPTPSQLEA